MNKLLEQYGLADLLGKFAEAEIFAKGGRPKEKKTTKKTEPVEGKQERMERIQRETAGTGKRSQR